MDPAAASTLAEWIERQRLVAAKRRRRVRLAVCAFVAVLAGSVVVVAIVVPDSLPELLEYQASRSPEPSPGSPSWFPVTATNRSPR